MKKKDLWLIVIALLIAALAMGIFVLTKKEGSTVLITIDGKEYKRVSLERDQELTIDTQHGHNHLVIKDGFVTMKAADCPDQICVEHAKIHFQNETIVCLPHQLVVEVIDGESGEIDVIAK